MEERLEFYDKGTAPRKNIAMMQAALEAAGPEYIEANGGGSGGAPKSEKKKKRKKDSSDDDRKNSQEGEEGG